MQHKPRHVRRCEPIPASRLSEALGASWSRVAAAIGRGAFADAAGFGIRTLERAVAGPDLPRADNLLNSLVADPTALDDVLALYGLKICPLNAEPANDMVTLSGVAHLAGTMAEGLADGRLDHRETLAIADEYRAVRPALNAIVSRADRIRGAA